jgi:H+/Cl- antiporter ClcA
MTDGAWHHPSCTHSFVSALSRVRRSVPRNADAFPIGSAGFAVEAGGAALVVGVAAAAAVLASVFQRSAEWVLQQLHGADEPVSAARAAAWWVVLISVAATLLYAAYAARAARRFGSGQTGLHHVAAAARGESDGPSIRSTAVRSSGTWAVSAGLVSIGRESAIIELGGGLGTVAGRHGRFSPSLATAGIVAAFATAYHAPISGVLYVEEHLGVRRHRRSVVYAVIGALVGHVVAVRLLGGHAIFPGTNGSRSGMIVLGMVALVPAVVGARMFFELRSRITVDRLTQRLGHERLLTVALVVVATGCVVADRSSAGNGMEAVRMAAEHPSLGIGLSMGLVRIVAATASLGTGAAGGAIAPSIAIAGGWALVTFDLLERIGFDLPGSRWDGVTVAMIIGVAVGIRSPLTAIFLVPEMTGDLSLIAITAPTVGAAMLLDQLAGHAIRSAQDLRPDAVFDEDA